jgi:hypothetical protein
MRYLSILILLFSQISCETSQENYQISIKRLICKKSQTLLQDEHIKQIWNLHSIDTTDIKIFKGCFLKAKENVFFISIGGNAGASSGSANRLNLIAHYNDSLIVDYGEQGALPDTILDFNNDGIDDFYFEFGSAWMGSCNNNYIIKSYANKFEHILFQRYDESVIDCGGFLEELYKYKDTLSTTRKFKFIDLDNDKKIEIIMFKDYEIYNGGKSEQEILASIKTSRTIDTIKINKINAR